MLFVGSPYSVRRDAIRDYLQRLREELHALQHPSAAEDQVHYHNYYTIYCVVQICLGTGIRPIKKPYPSPENIDPTTGLALIRDKDGDDRYNTRIVWLHPFIIKQLEYYRAHRAAVISLLALNDPKLSESAEPPPLFLLEQTGRRGSKSRLGLPDDLRSGGIAKRVSGFFTLPMNFERHFLRSNLTELGVGIEAVDAFMGHWSMGTEPWGPYSTFSLLDYVTEVRGPISSILTETGATPLISKFC